MRVGSEQIDQLLAMGFSREQAQEALEHCQNSVVLAVDWLLNRSSPPSTDQPQPAPELAICPLPCPRPGPPPSRRPPPSSQSSRLEVRVEDNILKIGEHLCITFERTLRVPDDGKIYPLPPSLGQFPILRVDDYIDRVPASWRTTGGVFIPLYQREACFIQFHGNHNHPCAVKVAVGKVNAISGKPWSQELRRDQNDYVCVPDQPWLDGINSGDGTIKQFVAMPLGKGYTVEAQVTGKEEFGGFQIISFDSKQRIPDKWHPRPPPPHHWPVVPLPHPQPMPFSATDNLLNSQMQSVSLEDSAAPSFLASAAPPPAPAAAPASTTLSSSISSFPKRKLVAERASQSAQPEAERRQVEGAREMGLAAGGTIKQSIHSDPYGIDTWDQSKFGRVFVHIVNSQMWTQITGQAPPETPISAQTYSAHGFPWFDIYEENASTVPTSSTLSGIKTVKEIDQEKYAWPQQDDSSIRLSGSQVHQIPGNKPHDPQHSVRDGSW